MPTYTRQDLSTASYVPVDKIREHAIADASYNSEHEVDSEQGNYLFLWRFER
jgi:hypothetical protein